MAITETVAATRIPAFAAAFISDKVYMAGITDTALIFGDVFFQTTQVLAIMTPILTTETDIS